MAFQTGPDLTVRDKVSTKKLTRSSEVRRRYTAETSQVVYQKFVKSYPEHVSKILANLFSVDRRKSDLCKTDCDHGDATTTQFVSGALLHVYIHMQQA